MNAEKQYTLKELKKKLTAKEKKFCHEYIIDWNGARAARAAGYSEKNDRTIAAQNLTKLHIEQYINFIKNDYEKECGITKVRQLKELTKIAYSSIADFHNKWIELKDFESLTYEQKNCIESIETKTEVKYRYDSEKEKRVPINVEYVKIKLYSKTQALDMINKMLGYNEPDKIDIKSSDGSMSPNKKIDLSKLTDKELIEYKKLQSKLENE